jgi:hypothetical protein
LIFRSLVGPLTVAMIALAAGEALAQDASPAPLPQQAEPLVVDPSRPADARECMKEFLPLREEAEKRGRLIKAATDRHAPPDEACKLIGSFGQAEIKLIKYLESHATQCGASTQLTEQLWSGHKKTEAVQIKICTLAREKHMPAGPTGDFWPSSISLVPQGLSKPGPKDFWMTPQGINVR